MLQDHWEILDVYKALLAVGAGAILGLERELKDKAAGLKTITIICLGATLFAILSIKIDPANPTALAAYIVSGVGFIGAGAIFRNGFTVTGLTTAGIIWLAAAVGTSIGFGEFYLAATFVASSLVIVLSTKLFTRFTAPTAQSRQLTFTIDRSAYPQKEKILQQLQQHTINLQEKKVEMHHDQHITISAELMIKNASLDALKTLLVQMPEILSFSF
jgi:putative Mg2+ transporter-C (MgtC) family protein